MAKDWSLFEDEIRDLYLVQDKQLAEVMRLMKGRHNFIASQRSYCTQLQKWGYTKYSTQTHPKPKRDNRPATRTSHRQRLSTTEATMQYATTSMPSLESNYPTYHINDDNTYTETPTIATMHMDVHQFPAFDATPPPTSLSFDVTTRDHEGKTKLHHAVIAKDLEQVEALLNAGVAVNVRDHTGNQPLHYAAYLGNLEIVEKLVHFGADPGSRGPLGRSPLHLAISNPIVVNALLDLGADPSCQDELGNTALHIVLSSSYAETDMFKVVNFLVESGCDVNKPNKAGRTSFHVLLGRPFYLSGVNPFSLPNTKVMDMIMFFLNHGADAVLPRGDSQTPLHIYLSKAHEGRLFGGWSLETKILELFLDKGASPLTILASGINLISHYFRVHLKRHPEDLNLSQVFCELVDPNQELKDGCSILHELVTFTTTTYRNVHKFHMQEFVSKVLSRGAIANSRNGRGQTPLLLLVISGHRDVHMVQEVVLNLLQHDAQPWLKDMNGICAIYEAIRRYPKCKQNLVKMMLRKDLTKSSSDTNSSGLTSEEDHVAVWQDWVSALHAKTWNEASQAIIAKKDVLPQSIDETMRECALAVLAEKYIGLARDLCKDQLELIDHQRKLCARILRDCRSRSVEVDKQCYDDLIDLCVQ